MAASEAERAYLSALEAIASEAMFLDAIDRCCRWCQGATIDHDATCPVSVARDVLAFAGTLVA